jgi:glycosyltransferase involved in cell wall biosynthesis
VIRQPNRGRSAARNVGLANATGDAIIFLDSDDLMMPECVERCAAVLERQPEVGVVYSDAYLCDQQAEPLALYSEAMPGGRPSGQVLRDLARRNFLTITSMVRRSCLEGIEFEVGMEHCEDYDFWRRIAVRCDFQYIDQPLMRYRFHEGMTVSSGLGPTLKNEIEVQQRIMAMPEFGRLSSRERARAYCIHGIKQAMQGSLGEARRFYRRSITTSPLYLPSYALWGVSLLGARALQHVILKRRQLAGNRLGTQAGPVALLNRPGTVRRAASTPVVNCPIELHASQGALHE